MFSKNSRLHSPKYIQKRRRKVIIGLIFYTALLAVLVSLFILLLRSSFLEIKTIEARGLASLSPELVQSRVLSAIDGHYFKIIPKSNIIFYPEEDVQEILKNSFKEIDNVEIKRKGLSKIFVDVRERVPAAIVCSGFHEEDMENNDCYFSDSLGYIFGKVHKPYPENYNRYYISTSQSEIMAGVSFIDQGRFQDLQKFMDSSLRSGIYPLGILISDDGEYEMYVKPDTTVYFDDRSSFDTTLSNLLAFWHNAKDKATSTPIFNYINLRFGNTIYYSNNNEKK